MKKTLVLAAAAIAMAATPIGASAHSTQLASKMQVTTPLKGINETPHGDMHATGQATITLYPLAGKVCFSLTVHGLMGNAIAAHIHKGAVHQEGPVVIPLVPPGKNGHSVGCKAAAKSLIRNIMKHPRSYYVNVHTKEYPGGAVRGQL